MFPVCVKSDCSTADEHVLGGDEKEEGKDYK